MTRTVAPSSANRRHVARPLPVVSPGCWPPPTTTAIFPFSLMAVAPFSAGWLGSTHRGPNCRPAVTPHVLSRTLQGRQRPDKSVLRYGPGRVLPSLAVEWDVGPELLEKATQLGHGVGM